MCLGCLTVGTVAKVGNSHAIEVRQGVDQSPLGSIVNSKQWTKRLPFSRNRFNAKAKPVYDVLNAAGVIRFSVVVPVKPGKFLGCLSAFYEDDYLAIVPGALTKERYSLNNYLPTPAHVRSIPDHPGFADPWLNVQPPPFPLARSVGVQRRRLLTLAKQHAGTGGLNSQESGGL